MPDPVLEIPDAGLISVKVKRGDGCVALSIDAYDVWNRVLSIRDECNDQELPLQEFHARTAELLAEKGLPRLNAFQVDQFVERLGKAVAELGKADGTAPTPDSPPSTEPVPSENPPA